MKSEKGSSILTTPVIIVIGMVLVSSLVVMAVGILTPYVWYEKLSGTCIKYVFIMEEYGYLTKKEKTNLLGELIAQGFDKEEIKIDCTSNIQPYGEKVFLSIFYNYKLKLPFVEEKIIPMEIRRISVSKR